MTEIAVIILSVVVTSFSRWTCSPAYEHGPRQQGCVVPTLRPTNLLRSEGFFHNHENLFLIKEIIVSVRVKVKESLSLNYTDFIKSCEYEDNTSVLLQPVGLLHIFTGHVSLKPKSVAQ